MTRRAPGLRALAVLAAALAAAALGSATSAQDAESPVANGSCASCHAGIEDIHPWATVTCAQCHGGNDAAKTKEAAHVVARQRSSGDERVLGASFDVEHQRFLDPGSLRAAPQSCGPCHSRAVSDVMHSLHATTSGHLGDGLYENGVVAQRHPNVSVFPVRDDLPDGAARPPGAVAFLKQIQPFSAGGDRDRVSTHFTDLPRKNCMQCHLWSRGRAVRGRAGMDGDYRGEGCSACHVQYADDGLSASRDPTVNRYEPGHPREHRMVRFPDTQTCARCHYGDASIGLSFRGLAQAVPGMPQSPDAPGLHRKRLNGVYYIDDPATTPADVHHQRGMHCVDCHTRADVMGDGFLYRRMEDAVEIRCETCHGTSDEYATGVTPKGTRLTHLVRRDGAVHLMSRVTGELHRVKQSRDIVRPGSADYNAQAALAMTSDHERLACHACHTGWTPNFFGFHFDRNEQFDQLDLLSGARTTGRVTTQEKVFSTFKNLYLGWDSHGRIAPYMVGFSSMATVHDKDGKLVLDQELPVTRAGLSGMTLIHHQPHTTTARARTCVECHRAPATFGRGSVNFRLTRDFIATGGDTGVRLLSLDRKTPSNTSLLSALPVADVRAIAMATNRVTGHAEWVFAASASEGLVACDVTSPGFPHIASRQKDACADPRELLVAASQLYVADGAAGLRVFDVSTPSKPRQRAALSELPAHGLWLDGTTLYVAAGPRGLAVLDVRDPGAPRVLHPGFDLNGADTAPLSVDSVEVLFQYSRPSDAALEGPRTTPRALAAVGAGLDGFFLIDVTEPREPAVLVRVPPQRDPAVRVIDVALGTVYELGSEGGALPTQERDDLFVLLESGGTPGVAVFDVTDATKPTFKGHVALRPGTRSIRVARVYNPPFLQTLVVAVGQQGTQIVDVSRPAKPEVVATLNEALGAFDVALEEFPLDRTVDADGAPVMDVSHEGARWLDRAETDRVLGVPTLWRVPATEGGAR